MTDDLYDGPCEAGCKSFHGGERKHHPDCGHYPQSLTKLHADRIEAQAAEIERLRGALKKAEAQSLVLESVARGPIEGERMIIWIEYHMKEARAALEALTGAKP